MARKTGFTLLELLIVIAIISILAVTLIPNVVNARRRSLDTATQIYTKGMVRYVTAWLLADEHRRVSDLATSCTDSSYTGEGAFGELPKFVTSCEILIDPNGVGTFGARVVSDTGKVFEYYF
jgi:type IV pilus assembly protein PilA